MSSNESAGTKRAFWDGLWRDPGPGPREEISTTPVWVQLEAINVRVPGMPKQLAPDGLDRYAGSSGGGTTPSTETGSVLSTSLSPMPTDARTS